MKYVALAFAILLSSAPARAGILSYGFKFSDATMTDEGRKFLVYIHPHEDKLMFQPTFGEAFDGVRPSHWPIEFWRHAAETFVAPVGCGIPEVHALSVLGGTWEASFSCPSGIDLHGLIAEQRHDLQSGAAIHVDGSEK